MDDMARSGTGKRGLLVLFGSLFAEKNWGGYRVTDYYYEEGDLDQEPTRGFTGWGLCCALRDFSVLWPNQIKGILVVQRTAFLEPHGCPCEKCYLAGGGGDLGFSGQRVGGGAILSSRAGGSRTT